MVASLTVPIAASISAGVTASSAAVRRTPSKRSVKSRSAASPFSRTAPTISSTRRWTSASTAAGGRSSALATPRAPSIAVSRRLMMDSDMLIISALASGPRPSARTATPAESSEPSPLRSAAQLGHRAALRLERSIQPSPHRVPRHWLVTRFGSNDLFSPRLIVFLAIGSSHASARTSSRDLLAHGRDEGTDPGMGGLQRGAIDDEPRRRGHDLRDLHQAVDPQRLARLDEIHDALGQPHQGGQLDGAVEADHLDLDAALGEIALGQGWILGGHANPRPLGRVVPLPQLAGLGHHETTEAEAQVHRLVDVGLLLGQDVLAHDAEVGRPVLDIGRN